MKRNIRYIIVTILSILIIQNGFGQEIEKKMELEEVSAANGEVCPKIDSIIAFAKTKLGSPYRARGIGPRSFDCSGFMYYVFGQFGVKLGRSSRDQIRMGKAVEKNDIRKGDLVFWYRGKGYVGHSGMVVDVDSAHNFTFIHASTYGKGVRLDRSTGRWYASTYAGARRIVDCDAEGRTFLVEADHSALAEDTTTTDTVQVVSTEAEAGAAPSNQPAVQTQKVVYHKINEGETLSSIARKYHVTVKQLKQWNNLKSDMIRAGKSLKIVVL